MNSEAAHAAVLGVYRMREQLPGMQHWVAAGRVPPFLAASVEAQIARIVRLKQEEGEPTRHIERHNAEDVLAMQLLAVPDISALGANVWQFVAYKKGSHRGRAAPVARCVRGRSTSTATRMGAPCFIRGTHSVIARQRRAKHAVDVVERVVQAPAAA